MKDFIHLEVTKGQGDLFRSLAVPSSGRFLGLPARGHLPGLHSWYSQS